MNKDKTKILMISSTFHPDIGGKERQALQLGSRLVKKGFSVSVLTQFKKGLPETETVDGVEIFRKIKSINIFPVWTFSYLYSVYDFLKKNRSLYDLIHCHQIYLYSIAAVWAGKKFNIPVIAKKVSTGFFNDITMLKTVRFSNWFIKDIYKLTAIIAICEKVREETLCDGFKSEVIVKIPNGVDVDFFKNESRAIKKPERILFAGRINDVKGIDYLINGFAKIIKKFPDIKLDIAGDGPDEEKLKALSDSLGLNNSIIFHGLSHNLLDFYKNADLFILPSKTEGFPNVLLEAMSCGLPSIASAVGGIPEILHPQMNGKAPEIKKGEFFAAENGILIPPESEDSIAAAIEFYMNNPDLISKHSVLSRKFVVDNYSFESIVDKYIVLYTKLISETKSI